MINAILLLGAAHSAVSGVPDPAWVRTALAKHSSMTRPVAGTAELASSTNASDSEIQVVLTGDRLQIVQSRVSNDPLIKAREALD